MSHELPEPLGAIERSPTTLLQEVAELDPAEMREFYRIIDQVAAAELRRLGLVEVDAVVPVSRLEPGRASASVDPRGRHGVEPDSRRSAAMMAAMATVWASRAPANRHCDAYWDFREAREYERNHAQRYAGGKAPPVTEPPSPPSSPRLRRVK